MNEGYSDSDILKIIANANEKCGYKDYAKLLYDTATIYEAVEIIKEKENEKGLGNISEFYREN